MALTIRIPNNRVFVLTSLRVLRSGKWTPRSQWWQRVFNLFDAFPKVPLGPMGMWPDRRDRQLWK